MSRVSLIRGGDRYTNVRRALELIEDEIADGIKGKQTILIKPNFVTVYNQLAATHVDAIRAVLDVISRFTDKIITIAEGAAEGETETGFHEYGYYSLEKEYNVRLVDLNKDDFEKVEVFNRSFQRISVKVARTVLKSDFRISVAPLKTHDTVIATLALKNMAVGSLCGLRAKKSIHQGYPAINRSIFELAKIVPPHLAVIDGFVGMEGNGPINGAPVDMRVALSGTDFLAVDTVGADLMGFNVDDIGYLHYCKEAKLGEGNLSKIEIVGNTSVDRCRRKFRPHSAHSAQLKWHINAIS